MKKKTFDWSNKSVANMAQNEDPVSKITSRARKVILDALDAGMSGPPFDPFAIADFLGIDVVPNSEIPDARIIYQEMRVIAEYNPNRSKARIRFSIAHEIAHTFFPDCSDYVRNRVKVSEALTDEWQVEALCNIGAAELLMPIGSFPDLKTSTLSIDNILSLREKYEVSTEAILLRAVNLIDEECAAFCISKRNVSNRLETDYLIGSRSWNSKIISKGFKIPDNSVVNDCVAIGFTAKGEEIWEGENFTIEAVALPPYPYSKTPRIVGLLIPKHKRKISEDSITYLRGDALNPRGEGNKLIVQVVNDKTSNWGGGGFAKAVKKRLPEVQDEFLEWSKNKGYFKLGNVHITNIGGDIFLASMIAQKGYGPSPSPRIRYAALKEGLEKAADFAIEKHCTVHMPRIGCGEAGGRWPIVEELLATLLACKGIKIFVYDLPEGRPPLPQKKLPDFLPFR